MKIQRNNKDIYMVWWPIFAVLLFVLSILALAEKVARLFGISWRIDEPVYESEEGGIS